MEKRPIKFRFWSNILNKFVIPDDSIFVGALKDENMEVMQFTGHKDKKGKEIYEGDIIQAGRTCGRVMFKDGIFQYNIYLKKPKVNEPQGYLGTGWTDWPKTKVIGNIYENPDLLTPSIMAN